MLFFFTPYDLNKKLLNAYDLCISLLPNDDDWAVLMDGDTMFLTSDFGHRINDYVTLYPETGLFTAYASRCFYSYQVPNSVNQQNDSLKYHHQVAGLHHDNQHPNVQPINRKIAGHLLVIKKKVWMLIRESVFETAKYETIEGIDTAVSNAVLQAGFKIQLMKSIYILHYFRMQEGIQNKKHLGYNDKLHIITPCSRPQNLHHISQSINIPRASYTWWIVFDANIADVPAHLIPSNARVLYHRNPNSVAGHAQRNYALDMLPQDNSMVYFLDDDTTLCPQLYEECCTHNLRFDLIHFDQQNPDGTKRIGGRIEVNHIDTGSAVVKRSVIGNTRFRTDKYNADGFFWKAIANKTRNIHYIPKPLSTYNELNP